MKKNSKIQHSKTIQSRHIFIQYLTWWETTVGKWIRVHFQKSRHNSRNISITIKALQFLADSNLHCGVPCLTLLGMGTSLMQCSVSGTRLQWLCMMEESATRNTPNSLHIYLELSFSSCELRTISHHQVHCSLHFQYKAPSEAVISYVVLLQSLGMIS